MASLKRTASVAGLTRSMSSAKRQKLNPKVKAQLSYAMRRQIEKSQELKFSDVTLTAGIATTGNVGSISGIAQGDSQSTRNGLKISPASLEFRLHLAQADSTNAIRIIWFQWFMDNTDYPPAADDILDSTHYAGAYPWEAPYNHAKRHQFRILYDKTYQLDSAGNTYGNAWEIAEKLDLRRLRKVEYNGNGTEGTGQIYYLTISDSAVSTHPGAYGVCRFFFRDS